MKLLSFITIKKKKDPFVIEDSLIEHSVYCSAYCVLENYFVKFSDNIARMGSEEEQVLDVEETIFVAVGEDVKLSKKTLLWTVHNFPSKKICLLHIHQPTQVGVQSELLILVLCFNF